jgi:hypothetical protein
MSRTRTRRGAVASPLSDRVSLGLGAYQVGGFLTSYAGSLNGSSFVAASDYSAIRITPSVAFALTDAIWLGGSLLFDCTSFSQNPLLVGAPTGTSYPNAIGGDSQPGLGFQAGLLWNVNDFVSLGASYASKTGVVSKDLLYVDICTSWSGAVGTSTCEASHRTPLFGDDNYEYSWDYDNRGARVAQLRFYEIETVTPWSPQGNQCTS